MIKIRPLISALALTAYGAGALAQSLALEEVIVTATKRSESLQEVPVAVTAFTAETIQEAGINNAADLAIMTPSLTVSANTNPFNARLSIRGIGTSQNDPALEPSVGLFVDGVFMGRTGLGMSDLTDIERIEVLQGPQGTLYGKNTNAGAISVITKRPNLEQFEGYVETSAGNYSMGKLTLAATGPLSDTVAYRLSGNVHQRDGYFDNSAGKDQSDADDWNVQGKLLWEPSDQLSVMLNGSHVDRDTTCCGADTTVGESVQTELALQGLPQDKNDPYDYEIATKYNSKFKLESDLLSLHIEYQRDWGTITSISAWNDYDSSSASDTDRTQLDLMNNVRQRSSGDSLSQELRLDSELGDNIQYQLGLFYYEQDTKRGEPGDTLVLGDDFLTIASQELAPLPIGQIAQAGDYLYGGNIWNNDTFALFGQATWHLGDRWHLTGGLRWTDEERKAKLFSGNESTADLAPDNTFFNRVSTPIDDTLNRSSDNVDWLLKAAYDISDDSMVYASVATGTKSGNFNGVNGTPDEREFDDEDTLSYELGAKSTLLDARLRLNAAAFYSEIDDYQSAEQLPTGIGSIVGNESKVEISGLDIQLQALPLSNLTLTAGLLYMHKYEFTGGSREGQDLPFTADFSGNLGATLVFPLADGGIYIRGDYIYMDDHATSSARADEIEDKDFDDRTLVNAKIGWRNDHWNLSIWGKNLTEDEYAAVTSKTQIFSGRDAYYLTPPRTYGATLRYEFY
jgi:iron complex outermembrane receptor protein